MSDGQAEKTYAQVNFEAYAEAVGGQTYDNKPIPKWEDLPDRVRDGWAKGAGAVILAYDPDGLIGVDDDSDDEDFEDESDYDESDD